MILLALLPLSCRTSSKNDDAPVHTPAPSGDSNGDAPEGEGPTPQPVKPRSSEFVGSCLRLKANVPDRWMDCTQFYTGIEPGDFKRDELHDIQKKSCEQSGDIVASFRWYDETCPSSSRHVLCPGTTEESLGVFGRRVLRLYKEEYPEDCR